MIKVIEKTKDGDIEIPVISVDTDERARTLQYNRFLVVDGKRTDVIQTINTRVSKREIVSGVLVYTVLGHTVASESWEDSPVNVVAEKPRTAPARRSKK